MYSFQWGRPGSRLTYAWSLVPSVRVCAPYSEGRARPRGASAVQGLLPRVAKHVFCLSLDPSLFLLSSFPALGLLGVSIGLAPSDLSAMVNRLHRAIGSSWTERLHSDTNLQVLACRTLPAITPRHVVMAPLVDRLRNAIEAKLASIVPPSQLLAAADAWRDSGAPAQALQRWPMARVQGSGPVCGCEWECSLCRPGSWF